MMAARKGKKKGTFGLSERNQYVVVGVLGAVLLGVLMYQAIGNGSADASPAPAASESEAETTALRLIAAPAMPEEPPELLPPRELPIDLFRLPDELKSRLGNRKGETPALGETSGREKPAGPDPLIIQEAKRLTLKGIMGTEGRRKAFISGQVVVEKQKVDGFAIVRIDERSVIVQKDETQVELTLEQEQGGSQPEPALPKIPLKEAQ